MNDFDNDPILMPLPLEVSPRSGRVLAASGFRPVEYTGVRTSRLERAVERLLATRQTGADDHAEAHLTIKCGGGGEPYPALDDDESYTLGVSEQGVTIEAPREWGVLRALATLTQLLAGSRWLPVLEIRDAPRFPWRGLMLDVARHFIPPGDLLRTLDAMAIFKLNVLHLHLSDDQGFRFLGTSFPELASDQHYTRAELDQLVRHAADRGIRVVPELDVPGHATSWLVARPEWGNRPAEASRRFGVHQACLDPTREEVLAAVETLFGELAETFPDACLHFGGDEVHPAWWTGEPRIEEFIARHGLGDAAGLQAWFNTHLVTTIARMGRRAMGWDEVLHDELPAEVAVQAWRGATARDRALAAGHDCVMSAPYYLDLFFPAGLHYAFDPAAPESDLLAREDALLEDPRFAHVAGGMAWTHQWREQHGTSARPDEPARLLGAEACLWSELVDDRVLDVRLWSRMPALAERFWSPADCAEEPDMYRRLGKVLERLPAWAGVDVAGDSRRLAAEAGIAGEWMPLVEMLEPVKWYGRLLGEEALAARLRGSEMPQARPYHTDSPLDRVVDALPPESAAARRLAEIGRAEAAGDEAARVELRRLARQWRELPAQGGPAELEEAAERLRMLGTLVADVLDGTADPADQRVRLSRAAQPMGEYLLAPALALESWLELRAGGAPGDG